MIWLASLACFLLWYIALILTLILMRINMEYR